MLVLGRAAKQIRFRGGTTLMVCFGVALLASVSAASVCAAEICSCVDMGGRFLLVNGAAIPSDSVGVPWSGNTPHEDGEPVLPASTAFTIERITPGGRTSVVADLELLTGPLVGAEPWSKPLLLIKPRGGFTAGAQYVFTDHEGRYSRQSRGREPTRLLVNVSKRRLAEGFAAGSARLEVAPQIREELRVMTTGGSCSVAVDAAQVPVELETAGALGEWRDILLFTTTVDGELWRPHRSLCSSVAPGESWTGSGTDLLFAVCGSTGRPYYGLDEGPREIVVTAWWPHVGSISASARIVLDC